MDRRRYSGSYPLVSGPQESAESPSASVQLARLAARRQHKKGAAAEQRRWRRRLLLGVVALLVMTPGIYSYTTTMLQPSSLPLGVRSVEWLRAHHGNWLVDEDGARLLQLEGPKKGGPQLKSLPAVGLAPAGLRLRRRRRAQAQTPRRGLATPDQAGLRAPAAR